MEALAGGSWEGTLHGAGWGALPALYCVGGTGRVRGGTGGGWEDWGVWEDPTQ